MKLHESDSCSDINDLLLVIVLSKKITYVLDGSQRKKIKVSSGSEFSL